MCLRPQVPVQGVVQAIGQPIAVVVAETAALARTAASQIEVKYEPVVDAKTGKTLSPIITLEDAIAAKSYLPDVADIKELVSGDVDTAMTSAPHTLTGRLDLGGQKHFYFENQTTLAVPQDDGGLVLTSSTQAPTDEATIVAKVIAFLASVI